MLDTTKLCINAEAMLEKSIWLPARKCSQPLSSSKGWSPPSTSSSLAAHPEGAGGSGGAGCPPSAVSIGAARQMWNMETVGEMTSAEKGSWKG